MSCRSDGAGGFSCSRERAPTCKDAVGCTEPSVDTCGFTLSTAAPAAERCGRPICRRHRVAVHDTVICGAHRRYLEKLQKEGKR